MFSKWDAATNRTLLGAYSSTTRTLGMASNRVSIVGLLLSVVTARVIAQGYLFIGGFLVLLAGGFDLLDGALAGVRHAAITFGAFLDSRLERYVECIILFELLFYALQFSAMRDSYWPLPHEQSGMVAFIFLEMVGSLMVKPLSGLQLKKRCFHFIKILFTLSAVLSLQSKAHLLMPERCLLSDAPI